MHCPVQQSPSPTQKPVEHVHAPVSHFPLQHSKSAVQPPAWVVQRDPHSFLYGSQYRSPQHFEAAGSHGSLAFRQSRHRPLPSVTRQGRPSQHGGAPGSPHASPSARHTSPLLHTPAVHDRPTQHSSGFEQAKPSWLQRFGSQCWSCPQRPEQQSNAFLHRAPTLAHTVPPHVLVERSQSPLQQSSFWVHVAPLARQHTLSPPVGAPHSLAPFKNPQHCSVRVHGAPSARHTGSMFRQRRADEHCSRQP